MSILARFWLAFGLIIGFGAVDSVTTISEVSSLSKWIDAATAVPLSQVNAAWRALNAFQRADQALANALAGLRDEMQTDMIARFEAAAAPIQVELDSVFAQDATIDHRQVDQLCQQIEAWRGEALVLLGSTSALSLPAPHVMEKQSSVIRAGLQALIADSVANAAAARTAGSGKVHQTEMLAVLFAAAFVVLGAAIAVPFARSLSRPLQQLQARMRAMMEGDMDGPIAGEHRRDEVGSIARALGFMRERLTERQRLQNEAALQRVMAEQEAKALHAAQTAAEQSMIVNSIKAGLEHLAQGHLTHRLMTPFPADYDQLRVDLNATTASLHELISGIADSTGALRAGIGDITGAADRLSHRTEQQAASLEQTAAALDEITATVQKSADAALRARTIVTQTQEDAEQSRLVVKDAVAAMAKIEQSSQQISQIIGVIDEIAFQTNLLALNV